MEDKREEIRKLEYYILNKIVYLINRSFKKLGIGERRNLFNE